MRNLILLTTLLATSALADVSLKVNRIEASVIDDAEESVNEVADAKAPANPNNHNASRSNTTRSSGDEAGTLKGSLKSSHRDTASGLPTGKRQHRPVTVRDAASGLPTGKRQHYLDPDSDDDGLLDRTNGCDDDCDSDVATTQPTRAATAGGDHNTTRSNRHTRVQGGTIEAEPVSSGSGSGSKVQGYNSSRSNRRGVRLDTNGDTAKTTMQKARHDSMQVSPPDNASKVEVRGWDPESKDAVNKDAAKE